MRNWTSVALCLGLIVVSGCAQEQSSPSTAPSNKPTGGVDGSKYLLAQEPDGAEGVIKIREAVKDGDDIVIVGRIGGSVNPWVENRAAFSIVDGSLKACSDIPGDNCETPWDYCCETDKLKTASALVKVVDDNGEIIKADARELLKVKELSTVVIQGQARRDEGGSLTVLAKGIYLKK